MKNTIISALVLFSSLNVFAQNTIYFENKTDKRILFTAQLPNAPRTSRVVYEVPANEMRVTNDLPRLSIKFESGNRVSSKTVLSGHYYVFSKESGEVQVEEQEIVDYRHELEVFIKQGKSQLKRMNASIRTLQDRKDYQSCNSWIHFSNECTTSLHSCHVALDQVKTVSREFDKTRLQFENAIDIALSIKLYTSKSIQTIKKMQSEILDSNAYVADTYYKAILEKDSGSWYDQDGTSIHERLTACTSKLKDYSDMIRAYGLGE